MKTTIVTAAMMILMTAATASASIDTINSFKSPEQTFKVLVNAPESNMIKFTLVKPAEEKVLLKIYGEKNNKLFQRVIKSENGLEVNCDMSDFGSGTYTCVVERNGKEVMRKAITLK
jgi:hypothetical protein